MLSPNQAKPTHASFALITLFFHIFYLCQYFCYLPHLRSWLSILLSSILSFFFFCLFFFKSDPQSHQFGCFTLLKVFSCRSICLAHALLAGQRRAQGWFPFQSVSFLNDLLTCVITWLVDEKVNFHAIWHAVTCQPTVAGSPEWLYTGARSGSFRSYRGDVVHMHTFQGRWSTCCLPSWHPQT